MHRSRWNRAAPTLDAHLIEPGEGPIDRAAVRAVIAVLRIDDKVKTLEQAYDRLEGWVDGLPDATPRVPA
jgi:hypothetical protein